MWKIRCRSWWRHSWLNTVGLLPVRRLLLWLALGPSTYDYMTRGLAHDPRLKTAKLADIVVRKDAVERRIEADWLKTLCKIVVTKKVRTKADRESAEISALGPF